MIRLFSQKKRAHHRCTLFFKAFALTAVLLTVSSPVYADVTPYVKAALHSGRHTGPGADSYNMAPSCRFSAGLLMGRFFMVETTVQHGNINLEKTKSVDAKGKFTTFFVTPQVDVLFFFKRISMSIGPTLGAGQVHLRASNIGVSTDAVDTGVYPGGYAALIYTSKSGRWAIGADVTYTAWFSKKSCVTAGDTTMCSAPKKWNGEGFVSFGGCLKIALH